MQGKFATQVEIFTGDCLAGLLELGAGIVDVVVTSPPYNIGINYRSYRDKQSRDVYFEWCRQWLRELRRTLRDDGSMFLNVGVSSADPLLAHEMALAAADQGWRIQNTIVWVKSISIDQTDGSVLSRGHFKPVNSRRHLNSCHEFLFHLTKSGDVPLDRKAVGVPYADKSNIARWTHSNGSDLRCRGNTWFVPYRTIRERDRQRPHPATFPVELAERCLRLTGRRAPVVMDPFLGLGTSGEAALRVGAERFIGFEIDDEYANWARQRLERFAVGGGNPAEV